MPGALLQFTGPLNSSNDVAAGRFCPDPRVQWYCLRSQPKREAIAAASLRLLGIDVFYPRLRHKKASVGGVQWKTEALFPNYLFARFDPQTELRAVKHARGVSSIVHFGEKLAVVDPAHLAVLQDLTGPSETHEVMDDIEPGDSVKIVVGPFAGVLGTVLKVKSGQERVRILFDFLGRQTEAELSLESVLAEKMHPLAAGY